MARGKRKCPKCSTEQGVRVLVCISCNYSFADNRKPKEEPKAKKADVVEKVNPLLTSIRKNVPAHIPLIKTTPADHAERILSYGKERATILCKLAQWSGSWKHVDWSMVEAGI